MSLGFVRAMLVDAYNCTHPKASVQPAALVASDEFGRALDPDASVFECFDEGDDLVFMAEGGGGTPNYIEHSRKKADGHSHYYWDNTAERRTGGAGGAAQPAKPKPVMPKKVAAVARPASSGDVASFRTIGLHPRTHAPTHPRALMHAPVVIACTRSDEKGCW